MLMNIWAKCEAAHHPHPHPTPTAPHTPHTHTHTPPRPHRPTTHPHHPPPPPPSPPIKRQAIIWTNDGLLHWRAYASPGFNELTKSQLHWTRDHFPSMAKQGLRQWDKTPCNVSSPWVWPFSAIDRKQAQMLHRTSCMIKGIQRRDLAGLFYSKFTPQTVMRVEFHPASNMAEHGKWRFYGMPIDNIELV